VIDLWASGTLTRSRPVHPVISRETPSKQPKEPRVDEAAVEARIKKPSTEARVEASEGEAVLEAVFKAIKASEGEAAFEAILKAVEASSAKARIEKPSTELGGNEKPAVEAAVVEAMVEAAVVEAAVAEAAVEAATMVLRQAGTGRNEDCRPGKEQQAAERECFPKHGYASSSGAGRERLHHNRDARSSSYIAHAVTGLSLKQGPFRRCELYRFAS
jgi:hypothetical protein